MAVLLTVLALAGLLFPQATYPNEALRQSFVADDVFNLVIGLPVLIGVLWLMRRAPLARLLGLPGALIDVAPADRATKRRPCRSIPIFPATIACAPKTKFCWRKERKKP